MERNYYEVLGVAPHVGSGQIQAAYRFARSLYSGDGAASHGLLDEGERAQMLLLVEEAYAALLNPSTRRDYDAHLKQGESRTAPAGAPERVSRSIAPLVAPPAAKAPTSARPASPSTEVATEPTVVPEVVTGAVLRSLRESRNLSIDQIAALSKVSSRFLKALEEDSHGTLPGRVFARGFLIEYARAIRAPESELVERYLRQWRAK